MAVPEKRKTRNIQKSIIRFVDTTFRVANSIPVANMNYRDRLFDASKLNYWVVVDFLEDMAGKKGFTMVQFDIYSRVAADTAGDQYGDYATELLDLLQDAMHVQTIDIYDFTADPETIIAKAKILVQNSSGKFREPEDIRKFDPDVNDVVRIALTFRVITGSDVSKAHNYD